MEVEDLLSHSSLHKLSKEEIITYHLKVSNLSTVIMKLEATAKDYSSRLEKTESILEISMNANKLWQMWCVGHKVLFLTDRAQECHIGMRIVKSMEQNRVSWHRKTAVTIILICIQRTIS